MASTKTKAPFAIEPIQPPLKVWEDGSVRVGGTRLLLDVVVTAYRQGYSPEEIAANFGPTPLAVIYGALDFYLQHEKEVDAYIAQREREAEEIWERLEAHYPQTGLRARLEARLAEIERSKSRTATDQ
jgi:uncharacterized protein (DUF433 family)